MQWNKENKENDQFLSIQEVNNILTTAYSEKNNEAVAKFFKQWNKTSTIHTKTKYESDIEENLYEIFRVIFQPYDLHKIGYGSWKNDDLDRNKGAKYIIVQKSLRYAISDDLKLPDGFTHKDALYLNNFRPKVDLPDTKVLYLTADYEIGIVNFLGLMHTPFGQGSIMAPSYPKGESLKRKEFLTPYVPLLYGHWGGYWHVDTHPEVELVIINNKMNRAYVTYRVGYRFGHAVLYKAKNKWAIDFAIMNGIE